MAYIVGTSTNTRTVAESRPKARLVAMGMTICACKLRSERIGNRPAIVVALVFVLGGLNTDPGRAEFIDNSADRWTDKVGGDNIFQFITEVGFGVPPTYNDMFNIDHVISDHFVGSCRIPGVTDGLPDILGDSVYFDHKPILCDLTEP